MTKSAAAFQRLSPTVTAPRMDKTLTFFDLPIPEPPRWFPGDWVLRAPVRKLLTPLRGRGAGGLAKVAFNLRLGLEKLGVPCQFHRTAPASGSVESLFGILHGPVAESRLLAQRGPCLVGPGVLSTPAQWPDLFTSTPAVYNVQNCEWAAAVYRPVYGDRVKIWRMGIDQEKYAPHPGQEKAFDFLIYDKIRWRDTPAYEGLLEFCVEALRAAGVTSQYIRYAQYPRGRENAYHDMLRNSRAMLFLSENETQGFAYNEALSLDVPILAWNFGRWCDPARFGYGFDDIPATSIPYWDDRCGVDFQGKENFVSRLELFLEKLRGGRFAPREYVLDNLRLEQGAQAYLDLMNAARQETTRL